MSFRVNFLFISFILLLNCGEVSKSDQKFISNEEISMYFDLDGNDVKISDYKGKRVLINFWATWCTPCLIEMPSMENAQEALKDENYVFLFATTDDIDKIKNFEKNNSYNFKFLKYNGTLDKLNIYALPATFIYNSKGEMVKRIDGVTEWDAEEMLAQLRDIP
jgi:thiol-disulfide isomerase/thioredoxin